MKQLILFFVFFLLSGTVLCQDGDIYFHPNRGQWDSQILYDVELTNGHFFLDKEGYTVSLSNSSHHHDLQEKEAHVDSKMYAFKIKYLNAKEQAFFEETDPSGFYRNYFLGNNSSSWKSKVYSFRQLTRKNLYPGIDVQTISQKGDLKINYLVAANAAVNQLQLKYEGFDRITIEKDGSLRGYHPLGYMEESAPEAWNVDDSGRKIKVEVNYRIKNNVVSFEFPKGYNENLPLVIDPILSFSTYTGSTKDNWGFTAAPDPQGNAFGGGIVFGVGYPVTTGAFDNSFGGGTVDAAISKFSADGTQLLYSTYLGGNYSEIPHSIVCNPIGEIYILGITSSHDFPTTTNAYQTSNKTGSSFSANNISFNTGSDIFVVKMSADGTHLLASTLIGGTNNDGINLNTLNYNYGDQFRGDITLDASGNVFVASTTYSANFPVVNSSSTYGGDQDAVVFKLSSDLSALLWSTYLGGTGYDAAYSIQVANDGSVYIAGGTTSSSLGFPAGIKTTPNGGVDGFVAKFNSAYQLQKGSFIGTSLYDQVYFIQLDLDQNVYVLGQSLGAMTVSPGKYGNTNSGQFIKKYDPSFSTELWTTLIGSGQKKVDISPTAFLVSDCYDIYIAGWGGEVNRNHSKATQSSTTGLAVTQDGYQKTTNGNNFYIAVLGPDAGSLKYATFIGGLTSSANHVDGGTSRFDKGGKIYHAVCAACGGNSNGFTSTPGVFSQTNKSSNCNMAVFKFEISFIQTAINQINPVICYPDAVTFDNITTTGNSFHWNFGDGTTSNQLSPTHIFPGPGNYTVSFVVKDTINCFISDTVKFDITVKGFKASASSPNDTVCPNVPRQLQVSGGTNYVWSPAEFLNNATIANPVATVSKTTTFMVVATDNDCGVDTAYTTVIVFEDSISINKDTVICIGNSVPLSAHGAIEYEWTPTDYLNDPSVSNPVATPQNTITYTVKGISENLCPLQASTTINVVLTPPHPVIPDSVYVCFGSSKSITVSGADEYYWSPGTEINTTQGSTVIITPSQERYYYCDFVNVCATERDSVFVRLIHPSVTAWNDTIICPGETAALFASGALTYVWSPSVTFVEASGSIVSVKPDQPTIYTVTGTDKYGCSATDKVTVNLYPEAIVLANPDVYAIFDEPVQLGVTTNYTGTYIWSPAEYLSCTECTSPYASPNRNYEYTITFIDGNGCTDTDIIRVVYEPLLYIPNSFTPDGSEHNDYFRVYGVNISDITLDIYDRWGELIHTIRGLDDYWDGTYKGLPCPIGTYVWKIDYTDVINDIILSKTGHVNLLR